MAIASAPFLGAGLVTAPVTTTLGLAGGIGAGAVGSAAGAGVGKLIGGDGYYGSQLGGLAGMLAGGYGMGRYVLPNVMPGRFAGEAINTLGSKFMEANGKNPQL